jgi:hypothetical protein
VESGSEWIRNKNEDRQLLVPFEHMLGKLILNVSDG